MISKSATIYKKADQENSDNQQLTVEEKIIIEKQYVGYPKPPEGPSVRVLFNELTDRDTFLQRVGDGILTGLLTILFLATFPLIALCIKLSSSGPVLVKQLCTGYRGHTFHRYLFRTNLNRATALLTDNRRNFVPLAGRILQATKLEELPSVLNILKGEMSVIGPKVRTAGFNNYWNNRLSEYYKRFAVKPGLIGVYDIRVGSRNDAQRISNILREELKYLLQPGLPSNLRVLFRKISRPLQRFSKKA